MSGTAAGGAKVRQTMIERLGSEEAWKQYMRERGAKGGKAPTTGGFKGDPELARRAGAKGGRKSRRTKKTD